MTKQEIYTNPADPAIIRWEVKRRIWLEKSPLKNFRRKKGLTLGDFALMLRVSKQGYAAIENGVRPPRLHYDKVTGALKGASIRVYSPDMTSLTNVWWDEHIKPLTGVSVADYMQWFRGRPEPEPMRRKKRQEDD